MMTYKGYVGRVEYDDGAELFHGEVINTRDVITFQGATVAALKKALRDSIEDYLAFCAERGEEPEKPFSGKFVIRAGADLHRRVSVAATRSGKSLNAWVTEQLERGVQQVDASATAKRTRGRSRPLPRKKRTKDQPI
jgi:predicted HicB family RNase H-like nuclease